MTFTTAFKSYACVGDMITCEKDGFIATARIADNRDMDPPWENSDGHGPVTGWLSRAKNSGERVLSSDHGRHRYYNFAEAVKLAKRNGWGYKDAKGTPSQIAAEAAERDFKVLKAWCDDEWTYCGIVISVSRNGVTLDDHAASLWGIELNFPGSANEYLTEVANELLPEALDQAQTILAKLNT